MRQAVVFGAGSVGRGLLGQLLCDAGWTVTFLDVDPVLVAALASEREYPHETVSGDTVRRRLVGPVTALDARDVPAAVDALVNADLAATCVGGRVLPAVSDTLAEALLQRIAAGRPPLNVLLAENVHHCAAVMRDLLAERLPDLAPQVLAASVGLLETSIGRMIPLPDPALRDADPTLVRVEPYQFLPYDAAAVLGEALEIPGLMADASVPFSFYGDRKLYVHNMGHCFVACLGRFLDLDLVWQAIGLVELRHLVRGAMLESALALAGHYGVPVGPLVDHVDDLIHRFGNRALADTTERVARDLERKLAADDRLLGAYRLAAGQGLPTRHLSLAIAAAATLYAAERGWEAAQVRDQLGEALAGVLDPDRAALLDRQLETLRGGLDVPAQLDVLDRTFEPSRVL